MFNSADLVGEYIVFNTSGNNVRLVAVLTFRDGIIAIARIMTPARYDRWTP